MSLGMTVGCMQSPWDQAGPKQQPAPSRTAAATAITADGTAVTAIGVTAAAAATPGDVRRGCTEEPTTVL